MVNINSKINIKLTEYLEFEASELFKHTDYLVVFGGAIRDIISGDDNINDIDIMCLKNSMDTIIPILTENGYNDIGMVQPDVYDMYKGVKCIFYPMTFVKGKKKVQLIRPSLSHFNSNPNYIYNSFIDLLKNVDLSSSGLFYDGDKIYECVKNSYIDCKEKKFRIFKNTMMYDNNRASIRTHNLYNKGWTSVDTSNNLLVEREYKINTLFNKIPYISEFISNNNLRYLEKQKIIKKEDDIGDFFSF